MLLRTAPLIGLSLFLSLLAASGRVDLDVALDPGRPFDWIKVPSETPTGGRPGFGTSDDSEKAEPKTPETGKSGETVTEGDAQDSVA